MSKTSELLSGKFIITGKDLLRVDPRDSDVELFSGVEDDMLYVRSSDGVCFYRSPHSSDLFVRCFPPVSWEIVGDVLTIRWAHRSAVYFRTEEANDE